MEDGIRVQFERLDEVTRILANGAHYADDPECHPAYPSHSAAVGILKKEIENRDRKIAQITEVLLPVILHGSDEHRQWLTEAIEAFLANKPIPEARGTGNKEERIAKLEVLLKQSLRIIEENAQKQTDASSAMITFAEAARKAIT